MRKNIGVREDNICIIMDNSPIHRSSGVNEYLKEKDWC